MGIGGGTGCVGSGGEVDHGELSGGAHREAQEPRAAPLLRLGLPPLAPVTQLTSHFLDSR